MHHILQKQEACTAEEYSLLKLREIFAQEETRALFQSVFFWYYSPQKAYKAHVENAAMEAFAAYRANGSLPSFFEHIPQLYQKEESHRDSPVFGRKIKKKHLSEMYAALREAQLACSEHKCIPYAQAYCPHFWELVFVQYFNKRPQGKEDPLWDTLFEVGMPALKKMGS